MPTDYVTLPEKDTKDKKIQKMHDMLWEAMELIEAEDRYHKVSKELRDWWNAAQWADAQ